MALEGVNKNKQTQDQQQQQAPTENVFGASFAQQQQQPQNQTSWASMLANGSSLVNEGTVGRLATAFREMKADPQSQFKTTVITVDNKTHGTGWPAVVLVVSKTVGNSSESAAFAFFVEDGREAPLPKEYDLGDSRRIPVPVYVQTAWESRGVKEKIEEVVAARTGQPNIRCVGATVVHRNFQVTPSTVENLSFLAIRNVNEVLEQRGSRQNFSLKPDQGMKFTTSVTFKNSREGDYINLQGIPCRDDITVTLKLVGSEQNNNNYLGYESPIISVKGYVDFLYSGRNVSQNPFGAQNQIGGTFHPVFVITEIVNHVNHRPEFFFLGILTARAIAEKATYLGRWAPNLQRDPLADIGALCVEGIDPSTGNAIGARANTATTTWTSETLGTMAQRLLHPTMAVMIDCSTVSPNANYHIPFIVSCGSDPVAKDIGVKMIRASCDALTNGQYSTLYSGDMFSMVTKFPAGYYYNAENVLMDARHCDYLAVVNNEVNTAGQNGAINLRRIRDWTDAVIPGAHHEELRMFGIRTMMESVLGGSFTPIGTHQRLMINAKAIDALTVAASNCGFSAEFVNPTGQYQVGSRNTFSVDDKSALGIGTSAIFNTATSTNTFSGFGGQVGSLL